MTRGLLVSLLCCPVLAGAQTAPAGSGWSFEAAAGLTTSSRGAETQTIGLALELLIDRALSQRIALRLAADLGAISDSRPLCEAPAGPCTSAHGMTMAALSAGISVTRKDRDAGPYASVRLGAYMSETEPGVHPGGYLGVGVAAPLRFGAVTFELGVHTYRADIQRLMVPMRVGLRWRP